MKSSFEWIHREISHICEQTEPCLFYPHQFFIAWHGVITLTFKGFPPPIARLKERLNGIGSLPPESPGSRWAKMTLAALSPNQRLGNHGLDTLLDVADRYSECLEDAEPLVAKQLCIIDYQQQSLEQVNHRYWISLGGSEPILSNHVLPSLPAEGDGYISHQRQSLSEDTRRLILSKGRHMGHYRKPQRGMSLVIESPNAYQPLIAPFRSALAEELPDHYEWFNAESRHITIRAL